MNNDPKKVIFIGGSSYSGSTMLDMMMANSKEGFSVGEVHALFRPFRPHHFKPECGCGNADCDFWLRAREAGERRLYAMIFKFLPDISFIVDSSKDPWWIKTQTKYLRQNGIEVYHLLIWKEPAAFAHSMVKRKRQGWERSWKNYYRLYLSMIDDYSAVPYSELARHPDQVLQDLCAFCGLEYQPGKEKFWQKQHHTLFGNDSAKIHLHKSSSNDFDRVREKLAESDNKSGHQSIYYDTAYKSSLTDNDRVAIESDFYFNAITSVLKNEVVPDRIKTICYSPFQLALARIRWASKAVAGRVLGRYRQIY